jgi:hypothetical protein
MDSTIKYFMALALMMLPIVIAGQELKSHKETQVRFEVVSVKLMSEDDLRKRSDNVGIDVSTKLRLTNTGAKSVYYYTHWKDSIIPFGHAVKEGKNGILWMRGLQNGTSEKSPGIPALVLGGGAAWLMLPSGASIEWPSFNSTIHSGDRHAETLFMKVGENGPIVEVVSDFYTVPSKHPD